MKVRVYPKTAQSLAVIKHPIDGPLKVDGAAWENDGYTARMLIDDLITIDESLGWKTAEIPTRTADAPDVMPRKAPEVTKR